MEISENSDNEKIYNTEDELEERRKNKLKK